MCLKKLFKKEKWPTKAKYQKRDFVRFKYIGELFFGFIYEAFVDLYDNVTYTIQMGGECPTFVYKYKEEDIIGLVPPQKF